MAALNEPVNAGGEHRCVPSWVPAVICGYDAAVIVGAVLASSTSYNTAITFTVSGITVACLTAIARAAVRDDRYHSEENP
jgi:hypothetical protein